MNIDCVDLPEGWTLLEAVVCYKAFDEDGVVRFGTRSTEGIMRPEAIGLLQLMAADQIHGWVHDPGED